MLRTPTGLLAGLCLIFAGSFPLLAEDSGVAPVKSMIRSHCLDCHDSDVKEGGLDLSSLSFDLADQAVFARWVQVHDRVRAGEMPPEGGLAATERTKLTGPLHASLMAADRRRIEASGRAVWRRLNRFEYEHTLRDLLDAPWLQIKEMLPEDGEAHHFNKVGEALDTSHVQMARYLQAAEYALRQVIARHAQRPQKSVKRYYARQQPAMNRRVHFNPFNRSAERATFPLIGHQADLPVLRDKNVPFTVGDSDPEKRELEAFGVVASSYEPLELRFDQFEAPAPGRYKLRFCAYSFTAASESDKRWWRPSREKTSIGLRHEPVSIYAQAPPRLLRKLGAFDVEPEPSVQELEVVLVEGETVRPDAVRLFRSRPPGWRNPLAKKDAIPGVAFRWMEVEGPIHGEDWPPAGHRLLFGDLPIQERPGRSVKVISQNPREDARRLLARFMKRAYRRPVASGDVDRFLSVIHGALDAGSEFADAMVAGYTAVLCSPGFVCLQQRPGELDEHAVASRLSYFLWNSPPDAELRGLATGGKLSQLAILGQQIERMLDEPKSERFVQAFLDYWLDLRKSTDTSPDATLYPDYYLDDALVESSVDETRAFFAELLRADLPARNVVDSDFAMLNERLAVHYDLPPVKGVTLRKFSLPEDSPRGGLLTQASVLKVTANGTTTSPVTRGVWVMERILGQAPPPPPPSVPAIEPDTRGAKTIREQLAKHRELETCNACHAKIDPPGFALENFDVLGGWRDHYRALGEDGNPRQGYGKNGQPFTFHDAQPVDASGEHPGVGKFDDVRGMKELLLKDERQIARNLVEQLLVYATGAPMQYSDRPEVERILDRAAQQQYGVRTLVHEIVKSPLFLNK